MDAENPRAAIGGNMPPDPFDAMTIHVEALLETAHGFLDGDPIADQATADMVAELITEARKVRADAEAFRKAEAKPFDDGKAAVQAKWTPITDEKKGRCALIMETAKRALGPWLQKLADEQAERERIAREKAAALALEAQEKLWEADSLVARQDAETALEAAALAQSAADRLGKEKAHASGTGRAIGLRSYWSAVLSDPAAALAYYRKAQPEALKAWLVEQANKDVRAGARSLPGFDVVEERKAQ